MPRNSALKKNEQPAAPLEKPVDVSKDEWIYQSVYNAIVEQKLAPGVKLSEDGLAEIFGVSRTIIRKALTRLTHDGFVATEPKRGSRVARPSAKEGRNVFEARRMIEASVLPQIVGVISEVQLSDLRQLDKEQMAAQHRLDFQKAIRLSGDFHQVLIDIADNEALSTILRNLISRSSLIVAVYGSVKHQLPSCQGHEELLQLIAKKETAQCQEWMIGHLRMIEDTLCFDDSTTDDIDLAAIFSQF